jgi:hypothetical protein
MDNGGCGWLSTRSARSLKTALFRWIASMPYSVSVSGAEVSMILLKIALFLVVQTYCVDWPDRAIAL